MWKEYLARMGRLLELCRNLRQLEVIGIPGISASLSEPAYAIFASWPKKRRSRILSEFIEDHRRCQNRTAELKRLRDDVKALTEALAESGYFLEDET